MVRCVDVDVDVWERDLILILIDMSGILYRCC